jgi:hypothetical protein
MTHHIWLDKEPWATILAWLIVIPAAMVLFAITLAPFILMAWLFGWFGSVFEDLLDLLFVLGIVAALLVIVVIARHPGE